MAISITKPTVNGSNNTWGDTINNALDTIVDAVNGTAGGPDITAITSTAAELNVLDGVTATTAELNILDGVTSTSTEINLLDGAQADTVVNNKAVIYGSSGEVSATTLDTTTVDLGDWTITQSGSELHFSYGGAVQFKMTSTGTFKANDDVAAEAF